MRRSLAIPLVAVLLTAAFMAARWLSYDLLFVDEWWSIFKSGGDVYGPLSPAGIWERIVTVDPGGMGAGYYILLGGWQSLVGSSPFAVRAFSLGFGLLAIAMTYRLGADWFTPRVGVAAAAMVASSAFFLNFMHEARAYTLVALMASLVMYSYWWLTTVTRPRFRHYAALTAALAGLAYSHYVALSLAVVILIFHIVFLRRGRRWWNSLGSMIAAALLYVPWLPVIADVAQRGAGDVNRQADSMSAGRAVDTLVAAFSNGSPALLILLLVVGFWFAARSLWPAADRRKRPPSPWILLALWITVGLGVALAVNAAVPFLVHLRYLIFLWPALAVGAALGVESLARKGLPAGLLLGVWIAFGILRGATLDFNRSLFGEIYRAPAAGVDRAMAILDDLFSPSDLVLFHFQQPAFTPFGLFIEDYLTRNLPRNLPDPVAHAQTELMNNSFAETDAEYRSDVLTILADHPRVWIVDVPEVAESQRTRTLMDTLAETYADCGLALDRSDATLRLFTRIPDLQAMRSRPQHQFGSEDTGFARMQILPNVTLDSRFGLWQDEVISLTLGWAATNRLRHGTHSVAVHLVNDQGVVVRQDDYPLPVDSYGCHLSVLTADLPDGYYRFYVSVYDWQSLETLPVVGYPDGRIPLDTIRVSRDGTP